MRNNKKGYVLAASIISILSGALLYYIFCPDIIFVRYIDRLLPKAIHIDLGEWFLFIFIRSYIFDLLWAFSFAGIVFLAIQGTEWSTNMIIIIPLSVGTIMELLQFIGIIDYSGRSAHALKRVQRTGIAV